MRLNQIEIEEFKNLKNFKVDFENSYYVSVFLGKNGTGKSNLLEFITIVFKCLDLESNAAKFKERFFLETKIIGGVASGFKFVYTIGEYKLRIELNGHDFRIIDQNRDAKISYTKFEELKSTFLPEHIIGYYSGRNQRYSNIFNDHINRAENNLKEIKRARDFNEKLIAESHINGVQIEESKLKKIPDENFRRLFYAQNKYAQLLLLTMFAFRKSNSVIKDLLGNYLNIDGFERFSVTLKSPEFNASNSIKDHLEDFWGVYGSTLKCVSYLYRISKRTISLQNENVSHIDFGTSKIKEALTLLIDAEKFLSTVVDEFNNDETEVFRHLESLYLSGILHEVVLDIKRGDEIISFSNLSEGEQQMIATLGLMVITGKKNSLYLMDEPDTHLNPRWQREYVPTIKKLVEQNHNSHVIISTHSPFIPQSVKDSDLLLIKKENGESVVNQIHTMHTWKIDQILTSEIYELETTRSLEVEDAMERRNILKTLKRNLKQTEKSELELLEKMLEDLGVGRTAEEVILNERMKKLAEIFDKVDNK